MMRIILSLFIVVVLTTSSRGDDSSPPILPQNVRASLRKNAALFYGILITGERSHRPLVPINTLLKRIETTESKADFTKILRFELRIQTPLFRESTEHPPGNSFTHDMLHEISFDGTEYRIGNKELNNLSESLVSIFTPSIAIEDGKLIHKPNALARMEFRYLHETGFAAPKTLSTLGQPFASAILSAAEHNQIVSVGEVADGSETLLEVIIERPEPWQSTETFDIETHEPFLKMLNGTDVLQMRMERQRRQLAGKSRLIRYWLNSTLGYAVVEKWELRKESGETMFHTKNSDFVQVAPDGIWMPKRCVVESHAYYTAPLSISPEPLYETVILMDRCVQGNFDDDDFRVWYDIPGTLVVDYTSPEATLREPVSYQVPASIDDLEN